MTIINSYENFIKKIKILWFLEINLPYSNNTIVRKRNRNNN